MGEGLLAGKTWHFVNQASGDVSTVTFGYFKGAPTAALFPDPNTADGLILLPCDLLQEILAASKIQEDD
jgi:hypothetical protein